MDRNVHTRIIERAHDLWLAYGCPPEGETAFLYQATKEVEFNDQLLGVRNDGPPGTADRTARVKH